MQEAVENFGGDWPYPDCVAGVVDGDHPILPDRRERGVEGRQVGVGVGDDRDPRRHPPLSNTAPSQILASFTDRSCWRPESPNRTECGGET